MMRACLGRSMMRNRWLIFVTVALVHGNDDDWVCSSEPTGGPSFGDVVHRLEGHVSASRRETVLDRIPLATVMEIWSDRVFEATEKPLFVATREFQSSLVFPNASSFTETYPCASSSKRLLSPWLDASPCVCDGPHVRCPPFGRICVSGKFFPPRRRRQKNFFREKPTRVFAWDRLGRFLVGLVFWHMDIMDLAVFRSLAVLGSAGLGLLAASSESFVLLPTTTGSLVALAVAAMVAVVAVRVALADLRRRDDDTVYDIDRGFYVYEADLHRSPRDPHIVDRWPRREITRGIAWLFYRSLGLLLLGTSSSDPTAAATLAFLAVVVVPYLGGPQQHVPYHHQKSTIRPVAHHPLTPEYTRDSLARLRAHLKTSAGIRALATLAPHPKYRRHRDTEIQCFLDTGCVLYHGYHSEYDD